MGHFTVRKDIREFAFPCGACESETFHVVAEELGGVTVGIVFRKKPLFATKKANQVICTRCETINARLKDEDVLQLVSGYIPKSIYELYPRVRQFYSVDTLKTLRERFEHDPESLADWEDALKAYRLEV